MTMGLITQEPKKKRRRKGGRRKRGVGLLGMTIGQRADLSVKKGKGIVDTLKNGFMTQSMNVLGLGVGFFAGSIIKNISERVIKPNAEELAGGVSMGGIVRGLGIMALGTVASAYAPDGLYKSVANGVSLYGGIHVVKTVTGKNFLAGVDAVSDDVLSGLGFVREGENQPTAGSIAAPDDSIVAGIRGMIGRYTEKAEPVQQYPSAAPVASVDIPIASLYTEPVSGPIEEASFSIM